MEALLPFVEEVMYAMYGHQQVDLILLDFAKAFDRVHITSVD